MTMPRLRRRAWRWATVASACALLAALLPQIWANAVVPETPAPVTGTSTYFDGLGSPYGGCGLPQSVLETQNFIALNVYDTPRDYAFYPRPVTDATRLGMWNNGRNCGRWVRVSVGDYCTGINDGAPNQAFCRNGSWVADGFNGATLDMVVADSCGDANAWCRDDPYHIDLARDSLSRFTRNGAPVGSLLPNNYNNRRMQWQFIPAPNYTGDIQIGFLAGAQVWWPAISVSRLPNGIHGVEYLRNGAWVQAAMNSDMGQSYIVGGTAAGGSQFQIRVRDVNDALLFGGRVYSFTLPCGGTCGPAYTPVSYTTSGGGPTSQPPTTQPTTPPTSGPTSQPPTTPPTTPPTASPTSGPAGACTATYRVAGSWSGNFQGEVTVRAGTAPITGWTVRWTYANGQTVSQIWSGQLTTSGAAVTVRNVGYNGSLGAGGSTTFGFLATWNNITNAVPSLTCTSP